MQAFELTAVLLTHAHLDHSGLLPKLVNEGFHGRVICTPATADITKIMLLDAAQVQEEDAAYKKKRHIREGRRGPYPEIPLYTVEDAEASLELFTPVEYNTPVDIGNGIEATFHDAGHVLGSSMIKLVFTQQGEKEHCLFRGHRPPRPPLPHRPRYLPLNRLRSNGVDLRR
jgi:metallo-beta-lactamase family protein